MNALARFSLLLVVLLVVISAYLRLQGAGIGCPDWPVCYAMIGEAVPDDTGVAASAYQRIVAESSAPLAWTAPLHRLVASVLGVCVLALTVLSLRARRHRLLCLALLGLTLFLATLGLRSGGLHSPAIVMGNLGGGFAMVGLLGWLVFSDRPATSHWPMPRVFILASVATGLLALQILLGGFTSANFAALACTTLPDCNGSYLPGPELRTALDLGRVVDINEAGVAMGGGERQAIHKAHRVGAVLTVAAVLIAGMLALRQPGLRATALVLLTLVVAEFSLGVATVLTGLPIGLAVAHNWLAALLLLGLLRLVAQTR